LLCYRHASEFLDKISLYILEAYDCAQSSWVALGITKEEAEKHMDEILTQFKVRASSINHCIAPKA
jgi:hypothetical protein